MRVAVLVFFDLEGLVFIFEEDGQDHIRVFVICCRLIVLRVIFDVEIVGPKGLVRADSMFLHFGDEVFPDDGKEFSLTIDYWYFIAKLVLHEDAGHLLLN